MQPEGDQIVLGPGDGVDGVRVAGGGKRGWGGQRDPIRSKRADGVEIPNFKCCRHCKG